MGYSCHYLYTEVSESFKIKLKVLYCYLVFTNRKSVCY